MNFSKYNKNLVMPAFFTLLTLMLSNCTQEEFNKPSCEPGPGVTVEFASSASIIAENAGSSLILTATLSESVINDVTVSLATFGTATEGTDYGSISDITISAGATTGTTSFTPTDDNTYEGSETAIISVSGVSGGSVKENCTQQATITIIENESAPTVTLASSASSIAENAGSSLTLTATLSGATDETVTVSLTPTGTGIEGTDYGTIADITISAGDTKGTASFTPTDDTTYEGDETAIVVISDVSGGSASEEDTQSVTITITENESAPTVDFNSTSSSGAESVSSKALIVDLSTASGLDVTVPYAITGTATGSGTDYTLADGTLTISAGSTSGTITIASIVDDALDEANETVIVTLSSPGNANLGSDSAHTYTITDNDAVPTVDFNSTSSSGAEAVSSKALTVDLSAASSLDVTVPYAITGTATGSGTDYTLADGTLTISAGSTSGTITIASIVDDAVYEGNETIIVTLSSPGNATLGSDAAHTYTITENENAPTVSLTASGTSVYDNGSNITLTATSSQFADEDITVVIGTSGTASEGSDYATISNITISAGDTTGTATFNPTEDTSNEGSETASISISSVFGADSSTSGTTSVTITITEYALRTGTTFTDGGTSSTIAAQSNWDYFQHSDDAGDVHPFEFINAHKAQSFTDGTNNLTGLGQTIHVIDDGCDTNMNFFSNKIVTTLDTFSHGGNGGGQTVSANHCNSVAAIAGGDASVSSSFRGVAPDVDFYLSKFSDGWADQAADINTSRAGGARIMNNSWGFSNGYITGSWMQSRIDAGTNTALSGLAYLGSTSNSNAQLLVDAYDDFQSAGGVIVWSNGNDESQSDISYMGSLPRFFPELEEAWLTVGNLQYEGSNLADETSETNFTNMGHPCGVSAREYCLFTDGTNLRTPAFSSGSTNYVWTDATSGTSWTAPMVSGGVALMKQAFPNHNAEQIVDRLLASADNDWFVPDGNTTFTTHGASITHGFDTKWGHGIMDLYAALSPITSNRNAASVTTGSNLDGTACAQCSDNSKSDNSRHDLSETNLSVTSAFGDSISKALSKETGYFYDGLNGGFSFDMSSLVNDKSAQKAPSYNIENGFNKLGQISDTSNFDKKFNPTNALAFADKEQLYITLQAPNAALQQFASYSTGSNFHFASQANPFIGKTRGLGLNSEYKIGNVKTIIGYHDSSLNGPQLDDELKSKTLAASFEIDTDEDTKVGFVIGSLREQDTFLFSKGSGALGYRDSNPKSLFTGLNLGKRVDNVSLSFSGTLAQSNMGNSTHSLVEGTSDVISSSLNASMSFHDVGTNGNKLSFSLSQPNRIEEGSLNIRVPGLADVDGNIPYSLKDLSLQSSGRQVDLSVNYLQSFDNGIDFGANITKTQDYNHVSGNSSGLTFSLLTQIKF